MYGVNIVESMAVTIYRVIFVLWSLSVRYL